jgi:SecD/SecF fusion protein
VTARRRNLFILLLVAGLLAGSLVAIATKPTRQGLDLRGGVELVYQAKPTPQQPTVTPDALDRAIEVMRDRVDQLGVSEPEIQRSGNNQIAVGLPDVKNAEEAQQQVGQVAQLYFYDWEPNVIGPDGKPDPTNPQVTGGQSAGSPQAALTKYDAVIRASKRPAVRDGNNTTRGLWYAVVPKDKKVVAGPEETRDDLDRALQELPAAQRDAAEPKLIKEGTIIVRAEQPDTAKPDEKGDEW